MDETPNTSKLAKKPSEIYSNSVSVVFVCETFQEMIDL